MTDFSKASEDELRECKKPWPKEMDELVSFIKTMTERKHNYGTCVYAMSLSALATFNFVASKLGVTGFQASCADLDFLARCRGMKEGFKVLDYHDLLYPQMKYKFVESSWEHLIEENKIKLAMTAKQNIKDAPNAHPDVMAHWEKLAGGAA